MTRHHAIGAVVALALAVTGVLMVLWATHINGFTPCDDLAALEEERQESGQLLIECFDGSETRKDVTVALAWSSVALAGIGAVAVLLFAVTGRRGRLLPALTGAAIVLGALSILIGSV